MKVTWRTAKLDDPIYKTGLTASAAKSTPSTVTEESQVLLEEIMREQDEKQVSPELAAKRRRLLEKLARDLPEEPSAD